MKHLPAEGLQYPMKLTAVLLAVFAALFIVGTSRADEGLSWPWQEYQAEDCSHLTGRKAGPSFSLSEDSIQLAEAVGRHVVFLEKDGDFVEWELSADTDVVSIRFSLPPAEEKREEPAEIVLLADGELLQRVALPREHLWVFGDETDRSLPPTWTDHRIDSKLTPRKAWDTVVVKLLRPVTKGTLFRIEKDPRSNTRSVAIDLIEAEKASPDIPMPDGFVSITDFGAMPNDGRDDGAALASAIKNHAKIYLPPGGWDFTERREFEVKDHIIQGAGIPVSREPAAVADFTISLRMEKPATGLNKGWAGIPMAMQWIAARNTISSTVPWARTPFSRISTSATML